MNAREKKGAAPANDKTSFEVTVLMPSRPEDFAVLVDKTKYAEQTRSLLIYLKYIIYYRLVCVVWRKAASLRISARSGLVDR